jgi:predicted PurR-regulated permease PerM
MLTTLRTQQALSRQLLDVLIRAGLIAVLAVFCFRIFVPFLSLMAWALILAITLYPLQVRLRKRLPKREGLVATLIIFVAFGVILVPTFLLGVAVADSIQHVMVAFRNGSVQIPPPDESVARWPLVGERVYALWQQGSTDLMGLAHKFAPQLKEAALAVLGMATGLGAGLVIFFVVLALAVLLIGIMQLPATLITIPVIIFVAVTDGISVATIAFAIYVFVAGLADNVLKPLLLGRGVAVPMPVVLIGALGGMVSGGVIGLFIGPVMLAVGYQLFWRWVRDQPAAALPAENAEAVASHGTAQQIEAK